MDQQQHETVARIIGIIARRTHVNDRDDMAQELWIEAIGVAERFATERGIP